METVWCDVALECKVVGEEMVIALIVSLCFRSSLVLESRVLCLLILVCVYGWMGGTVVEHKGRENGTVGVDDGGSGDCREERGERS